MPQPTGSTPSLATYSVSHTRRAGDTLAATLQGFSGGNGDGTMTYGGTSMTALADAIDGGTGRTIELFGLASPSSGSQALVAGGTGTPRGIAVRTYDSTTNNFLNLQTALATSTTVSMTRAAPNANNLGQMMVYISGPAVTITSPTNCSVVSQRTEDFHAVVVLDVTGANPSFTISASQLWIAAAFDVEGTSTVPDAPTSLVRTSAVGMAWTLPGTGPARTAVRVERRNPATSGTYGTLATLAASAVNYDDVSAANGVQYQYRVFAVNGAGDSTASNELILDFTGSGGGAARPLFGGSLVQ